MFEQIIWYFKGYVRIRVTGYSPERFLNACRYKNIYIWDLKRVCGSYEMNLSIDGFHRLKEIVRKTGTKVCIIRRSGLPFLLHRYHKRHILLSGFFMCICLMLFLTRYIWGIDIRGNLTYTDDTLKKFLASEQVTDGMKKSDVDCPKIVRDLRKNYDGIIWVSASVDGCKLIIRIKENEDGLTNTDNSNPSQTETPGSDSSDAATKSTTSDAESNTDIVADTDCIITSITTRTGIAQVQKGTQVRKGDILVSGQIPIVNDEKKVTGYTPCRSDADISGETTISYQKTCPKSYIKKAYYRSRYHFIQKKEYTIRAGNYQFKAGSIKNDYPYFEKNIVQKKSGLTDLLPLTFEKITVTPYRKKHRNYTKAQIRKILSADFQNYCKEMEKKGVEIIQNDVKIYTGSEAYCAKGTLKIRCSVGKQVPSTPLPLEHIAEDDTKNGD